MYFDFPSSLVPEIMIDISQSVDGSIIGLPHSLMCTVTIVVGVSPSLVKVQWSGSASLSESQRVSVLNQTSTESYDILNFTRTVEFSPLLGRDIGEYICSVIVTDFNQTGNSDYVMVMTNGKYYIDTKTIHVHIFSYWSYV